MSATKAEIIASTGDFGFSFGGSGFQFIHTDWMCYTTADKIALWKFQDKSSESDVCPSLIDGLPLGSIEYFDPCSLTQNRDFAGVAKIACNPAQNLIAIVERGFNPTVYIYSFRDGRLRGKIGNLALLEFSAIQFSSCGYRLYCASSGTDCHFTIIDTETVSILPSCDTIVKHQIDSISICPTNPNLLVLISASNLYSVKLNSSYETIIMNISLAPVLPIDFTHNITSIAWISGNRVVVANEGKQLFVISPEVLKDELIVAGPVVAYSTDEIVSGIIAKGNLMVLSFSIGNNNQTNIDAEGASSHENSTAIRSNGSGNTNGGDRDDQYMGNILRYYEIDEAFIPNILLTKLSNPDDFFPLENETNTIEIQDQGIGIIQSVSGSGFPFTLCRLTGLSRSSDAQICEESKQEFDLENLNGDNDNNNIFNGGGQTHDNLFSSSPAPRKSVGRETAVTLFKGSKDSTQERLFKTADRSMCPIRWIAKGPVTRLRGEKVAASSANVSGSLLPHEVSGSQLMHGDLPNAASTDQLLGGNGNNPLNSTGLSTSGHNLMGTVEDETLLVMTTDGCLWSVPAFEDFDVDAIVNEEEEESELEPVQLNCSLMTATHRYAIVALESLQKSDDAVLMKNSAAFVSADESGCVRLWNLMPNDNTTEEDDRSDLSNCTMRPLKQVTLPAPVSCLTVDPDGKTAMVASETGVLRWIDLHSYGAIRQLAQVRLHDMDITSISSCHHLHLSDRNEMYGSHLDDADRKLLLRDLQEKAASENKPEEYIQNLNIDEEVKFTIRSPPIAWVLTQSTNVLTFATSVSKTVADEKTRLIKLRKAILAQSGQKDFDDPPENQLDVSQRSADEQVLAASRASLDDDDQFYDSPNNSNPIDNIDMLDHGFLSTIQADIDRLSVYNDSFVISTDVNIHGSLNLGYGVEFTTPVTSVLSSSPVAWISVSISAENHDNSDITPHKVFALLMIEGPSANFTSPRAYFDLSKGELNIKACPLPSCATSVCAGPHGGAYVGFEDGEVLYYEDLTFDWGLDRFRPDHINQVAGFCKIGKQIRRHNEPVTCLKIGSTPSEFSSGFSNGQLFGYTLLSSSTAGDVQFGIINPETAAHAFGASINMHDAINGGIFTMSNNSDCSILISTAGSDGIIAWTLPQHVAKCLSAVQVTSNALKEEVIKFRALKCIPPSLSNPLKHSIPIEDGADPKEAFDECLRRFIHALATKSPPITRPHTNPSTVGQDSAEIIGVYNLPLWIPPSEEEFKLLNADALELRQLALERKSIATQLKSLRHRLQDLIYHNSSSEELEQVDRSEFYIDTEDKEGVAKTTESECLQLKKEASREILMKKLLWHRLKMEFWDSMEQPSHRLTALGSNFFVECYPVRRVSPEELDELERVIVMRKSEIKMAEFLQQNENLPSGVRAGCFSAFDAEKLLRTSSDGSGSPFGEKCWIVNHGALLKSVLAPSNPKDADADEDIEDVKSTLTSAAWDAKENERKAQAAALAAQNQDQDDEDGNTKKKNDAEEFTPKLFDSRVASLLYSPFEVTTSARKRIQIILLQELNREIMKSFNAIFDAMSERKQATLEAIDEKTTQLRALLEELKIPIGENTIPKVVPSLGEHPDKEILEVHDNELVAPKVLTAEEKAHVEAERLAELQRRREAMKDNSGQRALQTMMGGILKTKSDLSPLEMVIEREPWMDEMPTDGPDPNDEYYEKWQEYVAKCAELKEQQVEYTNDLTDRAKKADYEIRQLIKSFDDMMSDLDKTRLLFDSRNLQQTVSSIRLHLFLCDVERDEKISKDLSKTIESMRAELDDIIREADLADANFQQTSRAKQATLKDPSLEESRTLMTTFPQWSDVFREILKPKQKPLPSVQSLNYVFSPSNGIPTEIGNQIVNVDYSNLQSSIQAVLREEGLLSLQDADDPNYCRRAFSTTLKDGEKLENLLLGLAEEVVAGGAGSLGATSGGPGGMSALISSVSADPLGTLAKLRIKKIAHERVQEFHSRLDDAALQLSSYLHSRVDLLNSVLLDKEIELEVHEKSSLHSEQDLGILIQIKSGRLEALGDKTAVDMRIAQSMQGKTAALPFCGIPNFENAALVPSRLIDELNQKVKAAGDKKLEQLRLIQGINREINFEAFESKLNELKCADVIQNQRDVHVLRVTKDLQALIRKFPPPPSSTKNKSQNRSEQMMTTAMQNAIKASSEPEKESKALDMKILHVEKAVSTRLNAIRTSIASIKKNTEARLRENAHLEEKRRKFEVGVARREQVRKLQQGNGQSPSKSSPQKSGLSSSPLRTEQHAGGSGSAVTSPSKKTGHIAGTIAFKASQAPAPNLQVFREIKERAALDAAIRRQDDEIKLLRKELDRLRRRTFANYGALYEPSIVNPDMK